MMFFLIRASLPNSVAILALAMVPFVSLALSAVPARPNMADHHSPSVMSVAEIEAVASRAEAIDK
jgi:hypothetical protein